MAIFTIIKEMTFETENLKKNTFSSGFQEVPLNYVFRLKLVTYIQILSF